MSKKWLVGIGLVIPVVLLVLWPLSEQLRILRAPKPADTITWAVIEEVDVVSCFAVDIAPGYTVSSATDALAFTQISLDEAIATSRDVVSRSRNWPFFRYALYGAGPRLVYLDQEDGDEYLAWARMLAWDTGDDVAYGTGDLVFVDARNGDPLLLVSDVTIAYPSQRCAAIVGEFERVVDPLLMLIGLGIYVLLIMVVWSLWRARRLIKQGKAARQ